MDSTENAKEQGADIQPRVVLLFGPDAGKTIHLTAAGMTIGRVSGNDLTISSGSVSRHHAAISSRNGAYVLEDLNSHNGTFVNGIPIRGHELADGDVIRIAGHQILFLMQVESERVVDGEPNADPQVLETADVGERDAPTITMLVTADSREVDAGGLTAEPDARFGERVLRHLDALAQLGDLLVADVAPPVMLEAVAKHMAQVFPAEHVNLLLWDPESHTLNPVATVGPGHPVIEPQVSRTIARKVAIERVSLLCSDAGADDVLGRAASVSRLGIRSVLCTPLISRGRTLGVLYLENRSSDVEFTGQDLWLLRAMANPLAILVGQVNLLESMRCRLRTLEERAAGSPPLMIGESTALQAAARMARQAANSNATMLILGESGTGKEVLARNIHDWSPRRTGPFVVVNCTALNDQLLQSDLFGHERGAFTGAFRQKKGRLELADGGTIFLDEIGEIDREMQAKLLRFLQEHEFERVGGLKPIRVDVRVVAASNKNLADEVRVGRFRVDLYYRLRVVEVVLPPLRERRDDIRLLAQAFLEEFSMSMGKESSTLSGEALSALEGHDWPGNIRELRNCIERAVVLETGPLIRTGRLGLAPSDWSGGAPSTTGYHEQVRELKRCVIRVALDRAEGNQQRAAASLGLTAAYLSRLMKNLGMR